jgi:hypothetical protein
MRKPSRDEWIYGYRVEKINKRLWIVTDSGEKVYTPPDFLLPYIHNRQGLVELAWRMTTIPSRIKLITEFETSLRPDDKVKQSD